MAASLGSNRYGKSRVRLLKVARSAEMHHIDDWTVEVLLQGDFTDAFTRGDNSRLLPTDTVKNTVYSLARSSGARAMEGFARELATFLLSRNAHFSAAEVTVESSLWKRLTVAGTLHPSTFMHGSEERQTVTLVQQQTGGFEVNAGFRDMVLLKTDHSGFAGFLRDEFTTLPETDDRLLGTAVSANWCYRDPGSVTAFERARHVIRESMLRVFAEHHSRSVQETLFAMGEAALDACPDIDAVDLSMPNRHAFLVDLSRFGQDNPNQIFVPTDEPHGSIEARVQRGATA